MVLYSVISLGLAGLGLGLLLAAAEKLFAVKEDPRVEAIMAALPSVNCGACGFPGCSGYAAAVAQGSAEPNRCTVGGEKVAAAVAAIMGVEATKAEKRIAALLCRGGKCNSPERFEYHGITSCSALNITAGGNKACVFGCLGMGDCVKMCPFGAIYMNEDKIPVVIEDKCMACGKCVQTCPRALFELIPASKKVIVACKSHDTLQETRKACKVGCIACRLCEKKCPVGAIKVIDNLAVIDYSICTGCGICVDVCPQKAIIKM